MTEMHRSRWIGAALAGALLLAGAQPARVVAEPAEDESICQVTGDKVAAPQEIRMDESARVTLSIRFDCPERAPADADIVLVMDRSDSMRGEPLQASIAAARTFVGQLDPDRHRAALVSFATDVTIDAEPTHDLSLLHRAIGWLEAEGRTNIAGGLRGAEEVLRLRARPDAARYVLLLTDGVDTIGSDPIPVAEQIRASGTTVFAIGLGGVDPTVLQAIAGSPDRSYVAPSPADLADIYAVILEAVTRSRAGQLVIEDEMGPDVRLRAGSAQPAPSESEAARLVWQRAELPAETLQLSYSVEPRRTGLLPANRLAVASYVDADGSARSFVFPVPHIRVIAPTPTPSPALVYLPMLPLERCQAKARPLDVALVIDTSGSMSGPKIQAARQAARAFVHELRLPFDRAALISFGDWARLRVPLTGERSRLEAGIDGLHSGGGTPMGAALGVARAELFGTQRDTGRMPVVLLLSDGMPRDESLALREAEGLRQAGATVFSIGLGMDVNADFMRRMASPGHYHFAPTPEDLARVFEEIATVVVCW